MWLYDDFGGFHGDGAEDVSVAGDLVFGTGGFTGVVGELDGGMPFDGHELADEADGFEVALAAGVAAAEVVW
jgi:hypothetical protein